MKMIARKNTAVVNKKQEICRHWLSPMAGQRRGLCALYGAVLFRGRAPTHPCGRGCRRKV